MIKDTPQNKAFTPEKEEKVVKKETKKKEVKHSKSAFTTPYLVKTPKKTKEADTFNMSDKQIQNLVKTGHLIENPDYNG